MAYHSTHGHTPRSGWNTTYRSWSMMKNRCTNQNADDFAYYGGRGIKVCEKWMRYEGFLEDMGERPAGLQIDRIETNGHYEPGNCRWATRSVNTKNQRPRGEVPLKGVTKRGEKYRASIMVGARRKHLGTFKSPVCAATAFRIAASQRDAVHALG
jgi:hypothetical protein